MDRISEAPPSRRLEARPRDLDHLEQIAHVGSWTLDPSTGEAVWSAEMYRIFGLDPSGPAIGLDDIPRLFTQASVDRVTEAVRLAAETGTPWHLELEIVRSDGERGWVVSNGIAEDDADGVVRIHGTMHDVTEHRRLEAQVRQSQRLEAVGQLAGGIAHDFNNLLTAIGGYAELVRMDLGPDHPSAGDVDQISAAASRATDLVAQLLAFSRRQVLQPRVLDPAEVIDELLPLLRRLLGEDVAVAAIVAPDLGRITVDPSQFGQVIVNLAVNARDAMPHGGTLTIEAMNVDLDPAYAASHLEASAGEHILIAVSDTGHGMDPEIQARAFEPFFTTKSPDKGTGMGLSTVFGIVKQSGGSIYLYSEPGRGSTFKLYFPRTSATLSDVAQPVVTAPARWQGTETVLLVEDDDAVRAYARRVLEAAGFSVLEACDGSEAIALAGAAERLDLLLTDAVLPGLHGSEVAARLVAVRPELRVLFASGFTENAVIRHGVVAPGVNFLAKPYRADDLLRNVRAVLDSPS